MKLVTTLLLTLLTVPAFSQQADSLAIPSNSFEISYSKSNPTLRYSYDNNTQTHDYSNNWDFDRDGEKDQVYFIGTGGAHLYYFLKVVLSSDHKPREFGFIQTDFPLLTATDTLNSHKTPFGFVVTDIGQNLVPTIIVRLDDQTFYDNKELKKRKIKTKSILVSFENGITKYGCL